MSRRGCRRQGYGEEPHGGEDGEAAAHVVGDDIRLVAFLAGERAQCALLLVGYGHDQLFGLVGPGLRHEHVLEYAEGYGRLGGGARLGNHDYSEAAAVEEAFELMDVFLSYVLPGEEHFGASGRGGAEVGEAVGKGGDHGLRAEVGASDADADHEVAVPAQPSGRGADVGHELFRRCGRELHPSEEVCAFARAVFEPGDRLVGFGPECVELLFDGSICRILDIDVYCLHCCWVCLV